MTMPPRAEALHVLAFIHSFEPGGVERVALRLCREWQRAGARVSLAVGRTEGTLAGECPPVTRFCARGAWFPRRLLETLWMILWLPGIILRTKPDILFCPGNSYTIVAVALRLLLGRRCPPIVAKISNDLRRRDLPAPIRALYRHWCRAQGRWIDHFIAMSPPMRFEVVQTMRVGRQHVSTIYDAVLDSAQAARLAAVARDRITDTSRPRRFLALGRLVRQKNLFDLIAAFDAASMPQDVLTIAGGGPLRARLRAEVARRGCSHRILFTGHVGDVVPLIAEADCLIMASLYEGVPAAIVEGISGGLSLIATDCCVTMRDLVEATGGLLAAPGVDGLAEAIRGARPALRHRPAAVAIAYLHAADRAADAYLRAFRRILDGRRPAADARWEEAA